MADDRHLPPQIAAWARQQADAGVDYVTGAALWTAAARAFPGRLPAHRQPTSRDWRLIRDLIDAYTAGLPPIEPGILVTVSEAASGSTGVRGRRVLRRAVVTTVPAPGLVRVRMRDRRRVVDVGRITVRAVPQVVYTATIATSGGARHATAHGYAVEHGWWNPDRHHWQVRSDRSDATVDTAPAGLAVDAPRWLAATLVRRLGRIDRQGSPGTFHSREVLDESGRRTLTAAGHAHGFTPRQLTDTAALLDIA